MGKRPTYSLIIPIYNEEAVVPLPLPRIERLLSDLDASAEAIFVDDGSTDCSTIVLRERAHRDARFRSIRLSRNFGHQIAYTAGLDFARGDAVIIVDGDLQDPPEVALDVGDFRLVDRKALDCFVTMRERGGSPPTR